jgi:5-methylthioribose kinase
MVGDNPREIAPATAGAYLRRQGVVPGSARVEARSLGGGVSNRVVEVCWEQNCLVVKQPLANLAVADDWPADVQRVHNEAAAARAYRSVIDDAGLRARVPDVVFESEADHVIAVECAPEGAVVWKRDLLDGRVDRAVARTLGRVLGEVQTTAADDALLREQFASKRPFDQLRLDPYHRRTADRHPDVADPILDEADRIETVDKTLVHGDYSPKNVLVDRGETPTPWVLDFEVAHWGDPAFDAAFMLNHLLITSVYNHAEHAAYVDAARTFWGAYRASTAWDVEAETVAELGVLMLARVDGTSPVDYVDEGPVADALRRIAKRSLTDATETVDEFVGIVDEETAQL